MRDSVREKMTEYINSFSIFSATTIDLKKKYKKPLQNLAPRAVAVVTVCAEKY